MLSTAGRPDPEKGTSSYYKSPRGGRGGVVKTKGGGGGGWSGGWGVLGGGGGGGVSGWGAAGERKIHRANAAGLASGKKKNWKPTKPARKGEVMTSEGVPGVTKKIERWGLWA